MDDTDYTKTSVFNGSAGPGQAFQADFDRTRKSQGHVAFGYDSEFFHGPDGTLYRAPLTCPKGVNGYRQGASFECQPRSDGHDHYLKTAYPDVIVNS